MTAPQGTPEANAGTLGQRAEGLWGRQSLPSVSAGTETTQETERTHVTSLEPPCLTSWAASSWLWLG